MHTVTLSKCPLETPMSVWLFDSGPAPGPFSDHHKPTATTELKFGVVLPRL